MLAESIDMNALPKYLNNPNFVFEQKLDGHRLILSYTDPDYPPATITRGGTPYSRRLPKALTSWRPSMPLVLDGELVGDTYWVFDILRFGGTDLVHHSLHDRRVFLEQLFTTKNLPFKLVPQAKTKTQKALLASTALAKHYEGIMVKDVHLKYFGGRSKAFLKAKFVTTADVIVTEVRDDGKESCALGAYNDKGEIVVGRTSLIGKCDVKVGDVVEVRYLYLGANSRLYQPTLLKKRTDKKPQECTFDQFKMVNKNVLSSLPSAP
jgi:ATP-dependent DNA ligase